MKDKMLADCLAVLRAARSVGKRATRMVEKWVVAMVGWMAVTKEFSKVDW